MSTMDEWLSGPDSLATRLRRLREQAGLTGAALAERLNTDGGTTWTQPRISKIENGRQSPLPDDVRAWAQACGAEETTVADLLEALERSQVLHRTWRQQIKAGNQADVQRDYDAMLRRATRIRNAEVTTIPGLLQTPQYARHQALQAVRFHGADEANVDATVEARMRRQDILYDAGKRFEFVITEACLRLLWCPPDAMAAQLDRLMTLTFNRPGLWFGIIPHGRHLPVVAQNRFLVLDDLVIVEDHADEVTYRGERAALYDKVMDELRGEAVTEDEARRLIVAAMHALNSEDR
jgi:transcriptional regulator with XRE-family HTH domain